MKEKLTAFKTKINGIAELVKDLKIELNNSKELPTPTGIFCNTKEIIFANNSFRLAKAWIEKAIEESDSSIRNNGKIYLKTKDLLFEDGIYNYKQDLSYIEKVEILKKATIQAVNDFNCIICGHCLKSEQGIYLEDIIKRHLIEATFWLDFDLKENKSETSSNNI